MARISGVTLPNTKRVEVGLTYIYGIGPTVAKKILDASGIDYDVKCKDLTEQNVNDILGYIRDNGVMIEGDLKREVLSNVKRLKENGSYRGNRHARSLPARGQRSKTNSRTVRGNVRKTAGSGRKAAAQKT